MREWPKVANGSPIITKPPRRPPGSSLSGSCRGPKPVDRYDLAGGSTPNLKPIRLQPGHGVHAGHPGATLATGPGFLQRHQRSLEVGVPIDEPNRAVSGIDHLDSVTVRDCVAGIGYAQDPEPPISEPCNPKGPSNGPPRSLGREKVLKAVLPDPVAQRSTRDSQEARRSSHVPTRLRQGRLDPVRLVSRVRNE